MVRFAVKTGILCTAAPLMFFLVPYASAEQLAGYEPSETATLSVVRGVADSGLAVTWPLEGGVAGVPVATEGTHVLRMQWYGEGDRKVEIRHDWPDSTFDLPGWENGIAEIQVDMYIAISSALPGVVGIWDDVFGWTAGCPTPVATDEWVTVSMNVGHLSQYGLDHIVALLLDGLPGTSGTVYIDNLRLVNTRQITFAGRQWLVKSGDWMGPGPNVFSQSTDSVWVDGDGRLHLTIEQRCGQWICSEISSTESFGHGTYAFAVDSRVDTLDLRAILGLFTWDGSAPEYNYREIDFEFGRWNDPNNDNGQYVIQPWDTPGNMHRFDIEYTGWTETTTHLMTWGPDTIDFLSHYGSLCHVPQVTNTISSWTYAESDNPPPGGEKVRMNLWLINGERPVSGQDMEIIISDFDHLQEFAPDADHDGVRDPCDLCPGTISMSPVDAEGCPPPIPGDVDRDGDVDGDDVAVFLPCVSGPATPHTGDCGDRDFDNDTDVDQSDFGVLQRCLTGPYVPGDPACNG